LLDNIESELREFLYEIPMRMTKRVRRMVEVRNGSNASRFSLANA
jgi:hypothetical protein